MLEVTDDSGFLALIDPDGYAGFVDEEWSLDRLLAHFKGEMGRRRLLIWGTGLEGMWRVEVATARTDARAFREVVGPIDVSAGKLLVTSYERLTMAAGFRDVTLPEEHDRDLLVSLPAGSYTCRVLQLFDPDEDYAAPGEGPDFIVELLPAEVALAPWEQIPWSEV